MAKSKKGKVVEELVEIYKQMKLDDDHSRAKGEAQRVLLRFIDDPEITEWFNNILNG